MTQIAKGHSIQSCNCNKEKKSGVGSYKSHFHAVLKQNSSPNQGDWLV